MSEQEAIEMLDSFYEMDEMYISAQMGIKALKKQINGGWIPVSCDDIKNPKDEQIVIGCRNNGEIA